MVRAGLQCDREPAAATPVKFRCCNCCKRLNAVLQLCFPGCACAVDTAEDFSVRFDAVADDTAVAVGANRRQCVDRALEAVKGVTLTAHDDFKRLVVFVLANFACRHT
jgi:hypothetical protein